MLLCLHYSRTGDILLVKRQNALYTLFVYELKTRDKPMALTAIIDAVVVTPAEAK